jgi:hypothetical protein
MGQDTPLNRLHPDVNSNAVHKCTVTFDVAPHQQTMLRGIIDKNKELLRENLELGDVVEKLPQNITKGRKGRRLSYNPSYLCLISSQGVSRRTLWTRVRFQP